MVHKTLLYSGAALVVSHFGAGEALAQTDTGAAASQQIEQRTEPSQDAGGVADIVVTAERRESRLLETPVAVAAIATAQLERQGIDSFEDIQAVTPSLTFGKFSNYAVASLRGIGTDFGTISAEPSVAIFQDGVYLGPSSAQNVPSFDLERVEVLRGPQGTLYGRNAVGGTINYITRNPSFTPELNGIFELGRFGTGSASLGVSGPVVDDVLAVRVSGRVQVRDGYRVNDFNGDDADDLSSQSVAGTAMLKASDSFRLYLRGDYTHLKNSLPYERIQDSLGFNTIFGGSFTPDPAETRHFRNNTPTFSNFDAWGTSATAELELGKTTIRSISAYRKNSVDSLEDWDGSDANIANVSIADRFTQFTQEVNIFGTVLNDRVDWLLGGFYYDATGDSTFFSDGLLYSALLGVSNFSFVGHQKSSSVAGFGQVTAHVTDRLNLTGGLRYTRDRKTMDQSILIDQVVDICGVTTSKKWSAWTGTLSADYHVTDDAIVYARASKGYKAGGINLGQCADLFDPERLKSLEVGLRGSILNGKVQGALTAFYYDYAKIQFTTFTQTQATIDNVGGATVKGIELELNTSPARGLRFDGSLSFLDSSYDDQLVADPLLTGVYQIGGNALVRAPRWRGNLGAEYSFDAGSSKVTIRGETSFSAHYFHDIFNGEAALQSQTREPSYTISNARLIWKLNPRLEVQAFIENIEGNQYAYRRFVSSAFGGIVGQFSPPRTFGIRANVNFGR